MTKVSFVAVAAVDGKPISLSCHDNRVMPGKSCHKKKVSYLIRLVYMMHTLRNCLMQ